MLHREDPITRMLRRARLTELTWADIRSVDAEMRVRASTRYVVWGIAISFGLIDGGRKRHVVGYTSVSTKRLLTEMRRFAEMGGHQIEWPDLT
jgi:hypothetical protein